MTDFNQKDGFSVVSLIIPQARLHDFLPEVLANWPYKAIQFDCRGTIVREHWFQAFLPIMNPECEYLQFVVNDLDVEAFMEFCIRVNDLHLPGSGAIFCAKCTHLSSNAPSTLSHSQRTETETEKTHFLDEPETRFKKNLYAIYAMIQSGRTENAIKAAMQAGSHGPIVYFVEGRGIRDRAGWLKITKKPYEEVVMVLVEDLDRARVKEALVTAGRVNTLGGGVVFDMPITQGLVNLPTSIVDRKQIASNEQIAAAIDQLMGNTDWRDRSSLDSLFEKAQSSATSSTPKSQSVVLSALLPRKYANDFLDQILIIGIPGANAAYAKLFATEDAENEKGLHIHHELVQVKMVVPADQSVDYRMQLQAFATEQDYEHVTLYEHEVGNVERYVKKEREKEVNSGPVYRGVKFESA